MTPTMTSGGVGALHTATGEQAWFAIWQGHRFANATVHIAWRESAADDAERQTQEVARAQIRDEQDRRTPRSELRLPDRGDRRRFVEELAREVSTRPSSSRSTIRS